MTASAHKQPFISSIGVGLFQLHAIEEQLCSSQKKGRAYSPAFFCLQ